jgi:hypothetical protein
VADPITLADDRIELVIGVDGGGVPRLAGGPVRAEVLYPAGGPARAGWDPAGGAVTVRLPEAPAACLVRLHEMG